MQKLPPLLQTSTNSGTLRSTAKCYGAKPRQGCVTFQWARSLSFQLCHRSTDTAIQSSLSSISRSVRGGGEIGPNCCWANQFAQFVGCMRVGEEFVNTEENMFCSGGMDPLRERVLFITDNYNFELCDIRSAEPMHACGRVNRSQHACAFT